MKILFITPNYHPHIGGVEKHVREVSTRLVSRGHNVTVMTVKHAVWYPDHELDNGIEVIRFKRSPKPFVNRLLCNIRFLASFRRFLEADVVHYHDMSTLWGWGLVTYPLMKLFGKKLFITFHGWEGVVPPRKSIILKRKICEKLACGNICIGSFIEKWYGTKADLINYGGVNPNQLTGGHAGNKDEPLRVAYFGRLEPDTGIAALVSAVKLYSQSSGRVISVHVFGEGSLKNEILQQAADGAVTLHLSPPVVDVSPLLNEFPVIFASGYLSILEALGAGCITFAYYNNSLREDYLRFHPAAASLFICGTPREVVDGLMLCSENREEVYRKCEAGWLWAREQTWDNVAAQYLHVWGKGEAP